MKPSKMKSTESSEGIEFDEFQRDLELTMGMNKKNKKPKKQPKKEVEEESANDSALSDRLSRYRDEVDDDDDQQPGTSGVRSRVANGRKRKASDSSNEADELKSNIPPHEMRKYTKSLLTMLNDRDAVNSAQAKFFHLYDKPEYVPAGHTTEAIKTEMERYYKFATKKTVVSMRAMAFVINDFLNNPRSVETYPDFPVRPSRSPFHLFMGAEQKRLSQQKSKIKFTDRAKLIHEQWAKDKDLQKRYNDFWAREREEYVSKLDEFIDSHAELMEERREYLLYINKVRSDTLSMLNKNQAGGKKPAKETGKGKKTKMTAFDFFKQSKKDKYLDLPAEEREKKLLKRFNKIDPEQREIFESLAANQ